MHELHRVLLDAASVRFPPVDGGVDVVVPMAGDHHAVVEFTGHSFVLTDRDRDEVLARGADGFGGASHPDLLRWLAGPDGWIGSLDVPELGFRADRCGDTPVARKELTSRLIRSDTELERR